MKSIQVDDQIERKQEDSSVDHHIEQVGQSMNSFTKPHHILILSTTLLPFINEQSYCLL